MRPQGATGIVATPSRSARVALDALRYARKLAPISEVGAALVTGVAGAAAGGLHGLAALAGGASADEAARRIAQTREALTYTPRNQRVTKLIEGATAVTAIPARVGEAMADLAADVIPAARRGARDTRIGLPSEPKESDRPSPALLTAVSMAPDVTVGAVGAKIGARAALGRQPRITGTVGTDAPAISILREPGLTPRTVRSEADLAASGEAINRVAGQRTRGERLFKYDTLRGKASPLPLTVDAIDIQPGPRDIILRVHRDGRVEIDQGKVGSKVSPGLLKRAQREYEQMLGFSGGSPDDTALKPTLPTTEAERKAMMEAAERERAGASMSADKFMEMRYKGDRPLPGAKVATPDDPFVIDYVEGADVPVEMAMKVIQANYNDTFANNERIAGRPVPPVELSMDPKTVLKGMIGGALLESVLAERGEAGPSTLGGIALDDEERRALGRLQAQLVRRAADSLRGTGDYDDAEMQVQRKLLNAAIRYAERMANAQFIDASPRLKEAIAKRMAERRTGAKERSDAVTK